MSFSFLLSSVHGALARERGRSISASASAATWRGTRPPRAAPGRRAARGRACPCRAGAVSQKSDDLAGVDLDHLDVLESRRGPRRSAGPRPAAHDQLVVAVGLHARTAAARSSSRSPWKTRPSIADRGHVESRRRRPRSRGRLLQRARAIEPSSAPLITRGRVHLARGGGDQHVVALAQVAPGGERLPERGERERDAAADLLRVGRGEQRPLRVGRERRRASGPPAARARGARARRPRGRSSTSSAQRNAPTPPAASPPAAPGSTPGPRGSTCSTRSAAR